MYDSERVRESKKFAYAVFVVCAPYVCCPVLKNYQITCFHRKGGVITGDLKTIVSHIHSDADW